MKNEIQKDNKREIIGWFKQYQSHLSKEKVKYALAFCIANKLNPAKREVSLIPNKMGELTPCVDYQWQLDKAWGLGYRFDYEYLPNKWEPKCVECLVSKMTPIEGQSKEIPMPIGTYIGYVSELGGKISKPLLMTRIRTTTQAIKEFIPEMRHMLNNFEINEVIRSQNEQITEIEVNKELNKLSNKELNSEQIANFIESSDFGE